MTNVKIENEIRNIIYKAVEDNSGGMKMIELMTDLMSNEKFIPLIRAITSHNSDIQETVERIILSDSRLEILLYTSTKWQRQKLFIYTPSIRE